MSASFCAVFCSSFFSCRRRRRKHHRIFDIYLGHGLLREHAQSHTLWFILAKPRSGTKPKVLVNMFYIPVQLCESMLSSCPEVFITFISLLSLISDSPWFFFHCKCPAFKNSLIGSLGILGLIGIWAACGWGGRPLVG